VPELPRADEPEIHLAPEVTGRDLGNGGSNGSGLARGRTFANLSDAIAHFQADAPTCPSCGHVAVRNGACYKCLNCGESLGCS
jgi:hypothetical protein